MSKLLHKSGWLLALLAVLAPLGAQDTVPAIVSTYRHDPSDISTARTNQLSVQLTAEEINELYFESFVDGPMQGSILGPGGAYAVNAQGTPYPTLASRRSPKERMPDMPIVRNPGADGQYGTSDDELVVHIVIHKLPTQDGAQRVVDNMAALGLISSGAAATATGRWRLLVHSPRGDGAPPAPSVYYPEAVAGLTPDNNTPDTAFSSFSTQARHRLAAEFWGNLELRYTEWDNWLRQIWTNTATPTVQQTANIDRGIFPMPVLLSDPRVWLQIAEADAAVTQTQKRQSSDVYDALEGTQFFHPNQMWENRQLDADGTIEDPTADMTVPSASTVAANLAERLPSVIADTESPANEPIETLIYAGTAASDPAATQWWRKGIYTSGPDVPVGAQPYQTGVAHTGDPWAPLATPIELKVNLLTGEVVPAGSAFTAGLPQRSVRPGIGMIELQFEYEAQAYAEALGTRNRWANGPSVSTAWQFWGADAAPGGTGVNLDQDIEDSNHDIGGDGTADYDQWDLRGPDGTGGTADDLPLPQRTWLQHRPWPMQVISSGTNWVRDPLNLQRNTNQSSTNRWTVRRYSGWPYNPYIVGVDPTTEAYQGGPIVCRFVVSSINVLPEEEDPTSAEAAELARRADYDPANGRFYPQPDVYGERLTGGRDIYADLERAVFLLGYRADDAAATGAVTQDYFFPVRPGSTSATHRVYVQTTEDVGPGGTLHAWTDPANAPDAPTGTEYDTAGYPLRGPGDPDLRLDHDADGNNSATDTWDAQYFGFDFAAALAGPGGANPTRRTGAIGPVPERDTPSALLYWYDIGLSLLGGQAYRPDTGVRPEDAGLWDVERAFDGDTATSLNNDPTDPFQVPDGYSVGRQFSVPSIVDRVEVHVPAGAGTWTIQFYDGSAWGSPVTVNTYLNNMAFYEPGTDTTAYGVRVRNDGGAPQDLSELVIVARRDLRHSVKRPPSSPRQSSDTNITTTPLPDSSVQMNTSLERTFEVDGDNTTTLDLKVEVPSYQPPSGDAVERQILADTGGVPGSYETDSQPTVPDAPSNAAYDWDRYRGEVVAYLDNQKTYAPTLSDGDIAQLSERRWDVQLYQLDGGRVINGRSYPATWQFVRWYEEDSGRVAPTQIDLDDDGSLDVYLADLAALPDSQQRVVLEDYSTFDVELSVAYERRLRIAEKLLDFGKVLHGGISQWQPLTLVNEGNVPLSAAKLFIDLPLTTIDLENSTSAARLAQTHPVPSWYFSQVALGTPANPDTVELSTVSSVSIAAPQVGAPSGRSAGDLYLRVGSPSSGRRLPVGQPIGNYTGRVSAFVDDRGLSGVDDAAGDNDGQPAVPQETSLGGAATMKLTVQESPLARISGFWNNDVDQAANLAPYDAAGNPNGTFQPVPVFDPFYTDPDRADATPTIFVRQDPSQMGSDPPNPDDLLWVGWASYQDQSGGNNWGVYYRDAPRLQFPGSVLQTNYRSFDFAAGGRVQMSNATAGERNLYPSVVAVPGVSGDQQYLLLWHNERETAGRRASSLQFRRFEGTNYTNVLQIPDDASGRGLVNKQVPRAFADDVEGDKVLWVVWQSGESGESRLGFNAVQMPSSYNGAASAYRDAINVASSDASPVFVNYPLYTPPGLQNVAEPAALPSYRDPSSGARQPGYSDPREGDLQVINVLYSAWSPLWQNQDIYWSRYRPMEDPTQRVSLNSSPMASEGYRLDPPTDAAPSYTVRSLPGGRIPFPRVTNQMLRTNPEHTVYGAGAVDWVMPPERMKVTYDDGAGNLTTDTWAHRGFAQTGNGELLDPEGGALFSLRVFQGANLTAGPTSDPANNAQAVGFNLTRAYWDDTANEWVLPITSPAWLLDKGVNVARVHPGLGRVTFNKPLYRRGTNPPVYVYATYRPCAWRLTTDDAVDSYPSVAFDWWERLVICWQRTTPGGQGQLLYRTFSLAVPLNLAPATSLRAVVNDLDVDDDGQYNGSQPLSAWSFTGSGDARQTSPTPAANAAWSSVSGTTGQGFPIGTFGNVSATGAAAGSGAHAAAMVHFGFDDIGRRVRLFYDTPLSGSVVEEAHIVPGLGPERRVPLDGLGNESQPSLAGEHFFAGYNLNGTLQQIMTSRFWLAYTSTRDLYVPGASGADPTRGEGATNIYFGTFMPDFSPDTKAR